MLENNNGAGRWAVRGNDSIAITYESEYWIHDGDEWWSRDILKTVSRNEGEVGSPMMN